MSSLLDAGIDLRCGDAIERLKEIPDNYVSCCVTSPPYPSLRNYGCSGQIGLESTHEEYLEKLVRVFREVRRVTHLTGTAWIVIGDRYVAPPQRGGMSFPNLKQEDLVGIPWLLAFALRADGWWLRSVLVWDKVACMPESIQDRPTMSHEYIIMLSKSMNYYYDIDAIREPHKDEWVQNRSAESYLDTKNFGERSDRNPSFVKNYSGAVVGNPLGRNKRSVWRVTPEPIRESHTAAYPTKLIEPCILAGTSEKGVCPECFNPWGRVIDKVRIEPERGEADVSGHKITGVYRQFNTTLSKNRIVGGTSLTKFRSETSNWEPTCDHGLDPVSAVVLDPFCGSGTTGVVALRWKRKFVGIDLNPEYIEMARGRVLKLWGLDASTVAPVEGSIFSRLRNQEKK